MKPKTYSQDTLMQEEVFQLQNGSIKNILAFGRKNGDRRMDFNSSELGIV
jgi:hypothetical protein